MMEQSSISISESKRLIALENTIKAGKQTFVEVGLALSEIRDSKLYRSDFKTFEDYCREKWGWSKTHSNRLIEASKVVSDLTPIGVTIATESQARELAKIEPAKRVEVIERAKEVAKEESRPMTARDIREAVYDPGSKPVKPFSKDATEADNESDALFQLKRWWKQASKKDRKNFLRWVEPAEKKPTPK